MAKKPRLVPLYFDAYFAIAMFRAALEIAYGTFIVTPKFMTRSVSAMPEESVITLTTESTAAAPSRGMKALMVLITPTTFVLTYGWGLDWVKHIDIRYYVRRTERPLLHAPWD